MNFQQLEYIIAIDTHRHFAKAAEACHITQPTLSMMVQKLEEELDVKLFDRSKQPVIPTYLGQKIINQARNVLLASSAIKTIISEERTQIAGELKIGVIPTIAPYLLPMFLENFSKKYKDVRLQISENLSEDILGKLKSGKLDAGIMVMPDEAEGMVATDLYYEPFLVYSHKDPDKNFVLAEDLDVNELLLLEEGHCFRSQLIRFCELSKASDLQIVYHSGSLETLKNLTDRRLGITILPELATLYFSEGDKSKLKRFYDPQPCRKISILTHRNYPKQVLLQVLASEILNNIPAKFINQTGMAIGY